MLLYEQRRYVDIHDLMEFACMYITGGRQAATRANNWRPRPRKIQSTNENRSHQDLLSRARILGCSSRALLEVIIAFPSDTFL